MIVKLPCQSRRVRLFLTLGVVLCLLCSPTRAAYISEIDLDGPAGKHIELSGVEPGSAHTLLIIDANPLSSFAFGRVLDVVHLPPGSGTAGLATISDTAWPDGSIATQPISTLSTASSELALNLNFTRLLVVMDGLSDVRLSDHPTADSAAALRYDTSAVTDWLVLGASPAASWYGPSFDLPHINEALGVRLPDRVVDTEGVRVIARAREQGGAVDLDQFYAGTPGTGSVFNINEDFAYIYTPGSANLPLVPLHNAPEPGSFALLIGGMLMVRRCRRSHLRLARIVRRA